ncbi:MULTISPECIES: DUF4136 domain-containing protein [unclassified Lysobacter]
MRDMFRPVFRATCLSLVLLAAGCASTPTITSNYDHSANFGGYRTFGFFSPLGTDRTGYSTLVTQSLKNATRREMESRGYTYNENAPDLLVNFNGKLEKQVDVRTMPMGPPMMGYYGYRGGYYGGWGGYYTDVNQYTEGTLNVDLVDARQRQLVWEGIAVGRVSDKHRQDPDTALSAAVTEIFKQYPFRATP